VGKTISAGGIIVRDLGVGLSMETMTTKFCIQTIFLATRLKIPIFCYKKKQFQLLSSENPQGF
jgi:hypothetical protein